VARPVVTAEDVKAAAAAGALEVTADAVITEAARELAKRTGVTLRTVSDGAVAPANRTGGPPAPAPRGAPEATNRCLVTAVGRNRVSILAEITAKISDLQGSVHDISQRIVGDYFSTIFVVDLASVDTFGRFKAELEGLSQAGDYKIVVQHERIFRAMHRL
jgi:ACT domain-containing protein